MLSIPTALYLLFINQHISYLYKHISFQIQTQKKMTQTVEIARATSSSQSSILEGFCKIVGCKGLFEGLLLFTKFCLTLCNPMNCSTPGFPHFISRSLLKFISIESVMPSNHLILCHPLLLLSSIFPG